MTSQSISDISINMLGLSERFPKLFGKSLSFRIPKEKNALILNSNIKEPEGRTSRFSPSSSPFAKKKFASSDHGIKERRERQNMKKAINEKGNVESLKRGVFPVQKIFLRLRIKKIFKSFEKLSHKHYLMIGDLATSSLYNNSLALKNKKRANKSGKIIPLLIYKLVSLLDRLIALLASLIKSTNDKVPTFDSNKIPRIIWDLLVIIVCLSQVFVYSIEKCFGTDLQLGLLGIIVASMLWIDVLVKLNTRLYIDGQQIISRKKIISNFLRNNIFTDVVPCFCLSLQVFLFAPQDFNYLTLIILLKMRNAFDLGEKISQLLINGDRAQSLYDFIILIITILLWAHLIACLWHYIGYSTSSSDPSENNWLKAIGILDETWSVRYLYSMYWGVTTMLTVGYGDISPTNHKEMFFNIWAMVLGCGMFGYSMNQVGEILKSASKKRKHQRRKIKKIVKMMRRKEVPSETETKVKKYLEFVWKQEKRDDPEQEKEVFQKLSSKLRKEILYSTNVKFLKKVDAFKFISDKTLLALSAHMRKVRFSPEEMVYKEKDLEDLSIFFVIDGTLELQVANERNGFYRKTFNKIYKKNDYFGLHEVFSGSPRYSGVLSLDFSTVFKLSRQDLIQVLQKNSEEYEKFCRLRDLDIIYDNQSLYNIKCDSCGFEDHRVEECRFMCYIPNKIQIISKFLNNKKRKGRKIKRKSRKKENSLFNKARFHKFLNEFYDYFKEDEDFIEMSNYYEKIMNKLVKEESDEPSLKEETSDKTFENQMDQKSEDGSSPSMDLNTLTKRRNSRSIPSINYHTKNLRTMTSLGQIKDKTPTLNNKELRKTNLQKRLLKDLEYDRIKSFKHYFPFNNIENVIKRYKLGLD